MSEEKIEETAVSEKKPEKQPKEKKPLSRKSKKALMSAVISLLVLTAVVLVNVICVVLTGKYASLTADITAGKNFELTEQSQEIARNVAKKVTITFLSDKSDYENRDPYCKQTSVAANEMAQLSDGMISVEYTDLVKNPTVANDFPNDNLTANDVIVRCGENVKLLSVSDLFTFESYTTEYQYISSSQSEQAIDNAIVTVTSDVSTKTVIISDNTSNDYSYLMKTLNANNYPVTELAIETENIPEDTQMLVIYEPTKDFSETAIIKLENFILNFEKYGTNIIYIANPNEVKLDNLEEFIERFGMKLEDGLAFDMDESTHLSSSYYTALICEFGSNLYRSNFSDDAYTPVVTGVSRPVTMMSDVPVPLLMLSDDSGVCPYSADASSWIMKDAVSGSVCVAAQSVIGNESAVSNLVVIGSGDVITQDYFSKKLGNQNYFMTMFAEINNRDSSTITVADKVITDFDLNVDMQTRFWLGFLLYGVIPIIILGVGLAVFIVRRNL